MSKTVKIVFSIIILTIVIVVFTRSNSQDQSTIKIGVIAPLTGPVASYGEEMKKGIDKIASSSSAVFVLEDDKCDPKEAVSAFQKIVDFDKINFIIGPACGSSQEAIIPLIKNKNVIVLVPSAASKQLYSQSGNNFFNVQYSLEDESKFIGQRFNNLNYKKVALVHYRNAFSETHAKSFKESYKGEIVESILIDGTSDIAPELLKIKSANVDAIYSPDISFFFASGLIKLRQLGVKAPIYSTYVSELPAVRTLVPEVYYSFPADLIGSEGAIFELSKQSAEILSEYVSACSSSVLCVKDKLLSSGKFDEYGVFKREIVLKQIKNK